MKNLRHILKWSAIGLVVLLVLMVVGLALYTRTESFERWAQEQSISAINNSIRGSISVEHLTGSVWNSLNLYDVVLRYEGSEIVQIPRVEISFSLWPLIWGDLQIARVDAAQPRARLNQDRENRWNVVEALSPRDADPKTPSSITVLVKSLRLHNAEIDARVRTGERSEKLYRLANLNLEGRAAILPTTATVEVSDVTAGLVSTGQPELRLKGALAYRQAADSQGLLKMENFWAVSQNSRVKLNGQITHGEVMKIKAQAAVDKLAPADIDYFISQWPVRRDLTGKVSIDGTLDALKGDLEIVSAGAKVIGKFQADVTQDLPRYSATATLSGIDLRQWLGNRDFAGVVSGTVEAGGTGFTLQSTAGEARLEVRSTAVQGWALGTVSLDGRLENSVAAIDGRLQSKLGGAKWSGKVVLGGKRPTYEMALSVKDLDVQNVAPDGNGPRGKLNLRGTVKGAGFSLAAMNTRAEIEILPSSLDQMQIKQGALNLTVSDKTLRIARATLEAAEATLAVSGEFGLDSKMAGKLDYRFRAADLSPWLTLIKRKGSGSVDLAGEVRGNLTDLQSQGTVRLSNIQVQGIAVRNGDVKFALHGSKDQVFPQGVVTARLADIDAGVAMRQINGTARLVRQPSESIQIDLGVQDNLDRKHTLNGAVAFAGDTTTVRLSQLSLTSPDGLWKLARPAVLTKRADVFLIDQLSMKNGDRELSLNGRLAVTGAQDVVLNIDRFPVETLMAFSSWRAQPKMSGLLAVQARIFGTAAAPEITASARLSDSKIADQAYSGADAELNYKDKRAALRLTVQQDASHSLNGSGAVPLNLSWNRGWRADLADGMELRVQSAGLSVAFLNAFGGKSVENVNGEVSLDVLARGSLKKPDLRGTFRLRDGRVKVIPVGLDINQIAASGSLDSRNVNIREISARAKDGEIRGSGSLALKDYDIDTVKLSLTALRWPAIETMRHQVKIAGSVDVQGTVAAPKINGKITVTEGTLRPDLEFLEQSKVPFKRDETIVIAGKNGADRQSVRQAQRAAGANDGGLFKNFSVDLTLSAPGHVWIRHADLVAELSGNVHVTKRPEHDLDLTGRVNIVRGWYAFQGRRFQLARGTIQFTGGDKINPDLDILAQYRLPEYLVEVIIGGTSEKPSLTLASQPRLEQADILALLLFGRPINTLDRSEQGALRQSALSITSGFVAGRIANSVSTALGLDSLGVDIRDVDFSGGRVGFGRYLGSKTYVKASQQLTGEHGREVSLEYEIARDWKVGTSTTNTGSNGIDIIWHKRY